jgi:hypothetical protein
MADPNLDYRHHRFYDDDSSDPDTCTAKALEDANITVTTFGENIMLRMALLETANKNDAGATRYDSAMGRQLIKPPAIRRFSLTMEAMASVTVSMESLTTLSGRGS